MSCLALWNQILLAMLEETVLFLDLRYQVFDVIHLEY